MTVKLMVSDLEKEIESYLNKGYRLDMIMPADSPTTAQISKNGETILLQSSTDNETISNFDEVIVTRFDDNEWVEGRAGMQYRDLIPGRLGGRVIASHIRLTKGGPVPDYVHYHKVLFQMIYCKTGWIRVVYEDQGPPFVLNAGDCVLQPPEIRHRVLESSAGAEVIEIGCPAVHETWVDHDMHLPTDAVKPDRVFNGQPFVRHIAAEAKWQNSNGFQYRDTNIFDATNGLANVRVLDCETMWIENSHDNGFSFYFVLTGKLELNDTNAGYKLNANGSITIAESRHYTIRSTSKSEILQVRLSPGIVNQS